MLICSFLKNVWAVTMRLSNINFKPPPTTKNPTNFTKQNLTITTPNTRNPQTVTNLRILLMPTDPSTALPIPKALPTLNIIAHPSKQPLLLLLGPHLRSWEIEEIVTFLLESKTIASTTNFSFALFTIYSSYIFFILT